jgi:hypothetical protein
MSRINYAIITHFYPTFYYPNTNEETLIILKLLVPAETGRHPIIDCMEHILAATLFFPSEVSRSGKHMFGTSSPPDAKYKSDEAMSTESNFFCLSFPPPHSHFFRLHLIFPLSPLPPQQPHTVHLRIIPSVFRSFA